jgi:hypothetical protein
MSKSCWDFLGEFLEEFDFAGWCRLAGGPGFVWFHRNRARGSTLAVRQCEHAGGGTRFLYVISFHLCGSTRPKR